MKPRDRLVAVWNTDVGPMHEIWRYGYDDDCWLPDPGEAEVISFAIDMSSVITKRSEMIMMPPRGFLAIDEERVYRHELAADPDDC